MINTTNDYMIPEFSTHATLYGLVRRAGYEVQIRLLFLATIYLGFFLLEASCIYAELNAATPRLQLVLLSKDLRYSSGRINLSLQSSFHWTGIAWRGERVAAQLGLFGDDTFRNIRLETSSLTGHRGNRISAADISASFIHDVWSDRLNTAGGGCGLKPGRDSVLVADRIGSNRLAELDNGHVGLIWLSVQIPTTASPGTYQGILTVLVGEKKRYQASYRIFVQAHALQRPSEWQTHLDLWQNPFSVARWYNVKPWSPSHFRLMKPYMQQLAAAGQKTITATLIDDPWNGQTYDKYDSMIRWIKHPDGRWSYDFHCFDRWITFMQRCGITKQISCFGMIPWNQKFSYYDEILKKDTIWTASTKSLLYRERWYSMLLDFAKHLKKENLFSKTFIAMDERPLSDMQQAINIIKSADKNFKISLAGVFHAGIAPFIEDYSIPSTDSVPANSLKARRQRNWTTTLYTCCTEEKPNTFTFSPPAQSTWLPIYAYHQGFNGYLRWAFNCWNRNPISDARFGTWASGDAFLIYPDSRSSVRFERLIEGIQTCEKIRIMKMDLKRTGDERMLLRLNAALEAFDLTNLQKAPASQAVSRVEHLINAWN